MNKRPTIQTVAERAGVSRGTVDRVLNNRSYVRADVRERVLDAIRETGYLSPREAHRQTADRPQNYSPVKLGVLLPNWAGPFREEVTRGIESARTTLSGRHAELRVCICETDIPGEVIKFLDELVDWGAQGIALCALNDITIEAKVGELADNGIPCITFNSDLPNSRRLCFVGQDYAKSGRIAAELLTKCIAPDARILALAGNLEYNGHRTRLDGFCSHMREKGFSAAQIDIGETYNDYRVTYNKVMAALKGPTPPDALHRCGSRRRLHRPRPRHRTRYVSRPRPDAARGHARPDHHTGYVPSGQPAAHTAVRSASARHTARQGSALH